MKRATFLAIALSACASPRAPVHAARLPDLHVRSLERQDTELTSAIAGKPALVSLWTTWCDACVKEQPALARIDGWAKAHGAVVVGVAVGESIDTVTTYTAEHRLPWLVLVDEEFRFADALGEKRVPTTLVVDREGHVVYTGGAVDERSVAAFRKVVGAQ